MTSTRHDIAMRPEELDVVYHDHHLICVNKPARMPVASEDSRDQTLLEVVRAWNVLRQTEGKKGYCVPIHFIDRPVSGVILFALSSKAATRLNELFRNHKIKKTYMAVVEGRPKIPTQKLIHHLAKDPHANKSFVVNKPDNKQDLSAKRCELTYEVIAGHSSQNITLVKVNPVTGRSHQIRAQMAAIGHPLVGDVKYGASHEWHMRVALHARHINFVHPISKLDVTYSAPVPDSWHSDWPNLPWESV